jgi:hypothetical protein
MQNKFRQINRFLVYQEVTRIINAKFILIWLSNKDNFA